MMNGGGHVISIAHTKHGQVDGVGVFEVSKHSLARLVS